MKTKQLNKEKFITKRFIYFYPFFKNGTFSIPVLFNGEYFDGIIFKNLNDKKYYLRKVFPNNLSDVFVQVDLDTLSDLFGNSKEIITSLEPNCDCSFKVIRKFVNSR